MLLTGAWPYVLPVLYALFIWWLSTGVIIYLDNLPRVTHRWSMLGATIILAVALHRLHGVSRDGTVPGAYAAFTYGLLIWGWHEMSFFMGFITGPLREPCPPGCSGWPRFVRALRACLYHELASLASGAAVVATTWGGVNQVGTWTFIVLWWMRLSSKFNVFLGVRNLSAEFIPEHLAFIRSFLRQRPMNLLFPFSVTIATVVAVLLVQRAAVPDITPFDAAGTTFIAVLLILAIAEHWFLVLPLPAAALWNWSVRARQERCAASDARLAARRSARLSARALRSHVRWGAGFPAAFPPLVPVAIPVRTNHSIGGEQ
jgi:putative photosynthetic complex assembly protein 2